MSADAGGLLGGDNSVMAPLLSSMAGSLAPDDMALDTGISFFSLEDGARVVQDEPPAALYEQSPSTTQEIVQSTEDSAPSVAATQDVPPLASDSSSSSVDVPPSHFSSAYQSKTDLEDVAQVRRCGRGPARPAARVMWGAGCSRGRPSHRGRGTRAQHGAPV